MGLVQSLQASAEAALGDLNAASALARRDGLGVSDERARQVAQRSLNLLVTLAEKTRGNLTFDEADVLTNAIHALRTRLGN